MFDTLIQPCIIGANGTRLYQKGNKAILPVQISPRGYCSAGREHTNITKWKARHVHSAADVPKHMRPTCNQHAKRMAEREKNMRNMKKALAAVAAVATLASLTACGGSDGGNDAKANARRRRQGGSRFLGLGHRQHHEGLDRRLRKGQSRNHRQIQQHRHRTDTQTALSNAVAAGQGCPRRGHAGRPDRHPVRGYRRPR